MGQKVNPHGLRVGVIKDWDSRWFSKDETFGDTLVSDYKVRKYLKTKHQAAGIPKIEIERNNAGMRIFIHCAKPGMIIGQGGSEIEKLKGELEKMVGIPVIINVVEVRTPDMNAQLVAENIASQLERRISFRRAMKQCIGRTMRMGAKGIKVMVSGRLGGAEIARKEHYHEGTIPLQTLRADIDYGFWEANTTYGKIGVKVWIYKGEVLANSQDRARRSLAERTSAGRNDRRDRRGDRRGDRRPDRRDGGRGPRDNNSNNRFRGPRNNAAGNDRGPRTSGTDGRTARAPRAPRPQNTEGGAN